MDIRRNLTDTNTFYAIAVLTILAVAIAVGVGLYSEPAVEPPPVTQVE